MLSTSEVVNGSPARFTTRTDAGTPLTRNSSRIADGTVLISVTSLAAGTFANASAFSARITFPPQQTGTNISKTERSKHTDVDASTPSNSSGVKTVRAQETSATAPRCSSATPFGRPVEPEV